MKAPTTFPPRSMTLTPKTRLPHHYDDDDLPSARRERHATGRWPTILIGGLLLIILGIGTLMFVIRAWQPAQSPAPAGQQLPINSGSSPGGFTATGPGNTGGGTLATPAGSSAPGGASGQFGGGDLHTPVLNATANALGIAAATLTADLAAQQTIAAIAQAQHVALTTVNAAYLNALKTELTHQVQSGMMNQALADQMYQMEAHNVSQGNYFLLSLPGNGPPQAGSGFSG